MKRPKFTFDADSIRRMSKLKGEPKWMLDFRLESWRLFHELPEPILGKELNALKLQELQSYMSSPTRTTTEWQDLPAKTAELFTELRKGQNQKNSGSSAQLNSEMLLHEMSSEISKKNSLYLSLNEAVCDPRYSQLVRQYFMKLVKASSHKYTALHGAFWSGGSFVYISKNTKVSLPLQAYCRFEAKGAGQFGHTIIVLEEGAELEFVESCSSPKSKLKAIHDACVEIYVGKNAKLRYTAIENWEDNIFNLNTKRAIVEEGGEISWTTANFGAQMTVSYPSTILHGEGASVNYAGLSFADKNRFDTGVKVYFDAANTSAHICSKSIAKKHGKNSFRGFISASPKAKNCRSYLDCQSLILDDESTVEAWPEYQLECGDIEVIHEANIGKISEEKLAFLRTRGLNSDQARALILRGFANSISSDLPFSFSSEIRRILDERKFS